MAKEEALKAPSKASQLKDYDEILRRVVADAKRERDDLEHQLLLKKNNLIQVQEQIVRQQGDFEKWKRAETEKLSQLKNKKENEYAERDRALRINEDNLAKRSHELEERELRVRDLMDEKSSLALERIEVQKLYTRAEEMTKDAHLKMAEADNKYHKASMAESSIKDREAKLETNRRNLITQEDDIAKKQADVKAREKNVEEIRKVIDPRIEELKMVEANIKTREKELDSKEAEVKAKLEEQRIILKSLETREQKVKEREKAILQREEEVTRKILLAGIDKK